MLQVLSFIEHVIILCAITRTVLNSDKSSARHLKISCHGTEIIPPDIHIITSTVNHMRMRIMCALLGFHIHKCLHYDVWKEVGRSLKD